MNVIRATLNKKSRGRGGKNRNVPVFNTYFRGTLGRRSLSHASNSDFSSVPQVGKVLGTAQRNGSKSISSNSALFTPNFNLTFGDKPVPKEPHITNQFLEETFRTLEVPYATSSSSSKIFNHNEPLLRSLPPPNSAVIVRKSRSISSSNAQPRSTPSHIRTPRTPKTVSSTVDSNHYMTIALTEGRGLARGEVGLAAMDVYRPHLVMCQISDTQTYVNTITKIYITHPVEILVPATFVDTQQSNKLFELVRENFPQVTITTVQRRHFNDAIGLQNIRSLCLPEYANVQFVVGQKFYALAAVAALLKYIEFMKNVIFAPKSLKIEYQSPENVMAIDIGTASRLELVMPRRGADRQASLLGVLDHCSTTSGKRSLRANILQPPTDLDTIRSRLVSVSELSQDPTLLHSIQSAVSKFQNVEQLLWLCVQVRSFQSDTSASELQTNYILLLKTSLECLPHLTESLQPAKTPYFHKVLEHLDDERFSQLLKIILETINDDARTKKGFAASQFQRCFAIKTKVCGMLDIARSAYSNLVANMHENVQKLSEEFNLPLRAVTTGNKGLHIQLSVTRRSGFSVKDLPAVFIQVSRSRNLVTCTTEELVVLNHRLKIVINEIQLASNRIIQELLCKLREHVSCLYRLCEDIAELDLLVSLALVSSAYGYVMPTFSDKMDIRQCRHPILDFISPAKPVANDVFASKEKNFHIITGPNMGGKSIYIRQVALLQIMAQIGCFVPADKAEFKIMNKIFSRLGFDDSIEYNASCFVMEIKEMQYILQSLGPQSLVVIDELCRSTDYEEGTAIAWGFCEQLLRTTAFTFFTTHYLYLTRLHKQFPNVSNHQMLAEVNAAGRLVYTHQLVTGVTRLVLYGLRLAQNCLLPDTLLRQAREICTDLAHQRLGEEAEWLSDEECTSVEEDNKYINELVNLAKTDKFNLEEIMKVQHVLKSKLNVQSDLKTLSTPRQSDLTAVNEANNVMLSGDEREKQQSSQNLERILNRNFDNEEIPHVSPLLLQDSGNNQLSPMNYFKRRCLSSSFQTEKQSAVHQRFDESPYQSIAVGAKESAENSDYPHEFRTPILPREFVMSRNKPPNNTASATRKNPPKSPFMINMTHDLDEPSDYMFSQSFVPSVSLVEFTSPIVSNLRSHHGNYESPHTTQHDASHRFSASPADDSQRPANLELELYEDSTALSQFRMEPLCDEIDCHSEKGPRFRNFIMNSQSNAQSQSCVVDNTKEGHFRNLGGSQKTHLLRSNKSLDARFSEELSNRQSLLPSPCDKPYSVPTYLSGLAGHELRRSPMSNNSPMVLDLLPDFQNVPRNISFDDEKDMFEE